MDAISNMIIQIKNAGNAGHDNTFISYSKLKHSVADVLKKEGFIKDVEVKTEKGKKVLSLGLFIENRIPKIKGVQRISKPSKKFTRNSRKSVLLKMVTVLLFSPLPKE